MSAEPRDVGEEVLRIAAEEAARLRHRYVGTEHLLLALLRTGDPEIEARLRRTGVENATVRHALEAALPEGKGSDEVSDSRPLTARANRVLEIYSSDSEGSRPVIASRLALLEAILAEEKNIAAQVLRELGAES